MSIDAVAVLSIPASELRKRFAPTRRVEDGIEEATSVGGEPMLFQGVRAGVLLHMGVPFEWSDQDLIDRLHTLLGNHLNRHNDKRGILVFPDAGQPEGSSYATVVLELRNDGKWLRIDGEPKRRKADFPLADFMTPEQIHLVQSAPYSGDPSKMAEAEKILQGAIAAAGGEGRVKGILSDWLDKHRR